MFAILSNRFKKALWSQIIISRAWAVFGLPGDELIWEEQKKLAKQARRSMGSMWDA